MANRGNLIKTDATMGRTTATGNYRLETEQALSEVRTRRSALAAERNAIDREDSDLIFLEEMLLRDLRELDEHVKALAAE